MRTIIFLTLIIAFVQCGGSSTKEDKQNTENVTNEREVICFVYHRFGDSRFPSTNVSVSDFEAHLKYLKTNNYKVMTFREAISYIKEGGSYEKAAVITIDDGYKSFYKNGLPLLEKYEFPATLFINTKTVGGNDYMDWSDLKSVISRGIEIGNHTHSHDYFLNLPETSRYSSFKEELELSQDLIQKNLDIIPETFAYPYGELDEQMKSIVENTGFIGAAAQNSGVIYHGTDIMQCPRFPMSEYYSDPKKFISKANMRPIRVLSESPESFLLPKGKTRPVLTLKIQNEDLITSEINCYVQGGSGSVNVIDAGNDVSEVRIRSNTDISKRRRTLYTITVQDKEGDWHWFSHLWINPDIR